jgi:hypothetical protein
MKVNKSAMIWQGWNSLVKPLITGTRELAAKLLILSWPVGANHHQVGHAADDFGAVFNRFRATQLAVACGEVNHRATQLIHACFKAHARARGGLLENHRQRTVGQCVVLFVGFKFLLDQRGALEHVGVFVCR